MSIIRALFDKTAYNAADAFGAADKTSQAMQEAIKDWVSLYYDKTVTKTEDPCQQIPYTIVRKLTKTTFAEYSATSEDKYAKMVLDSLTPHQKKALDLVMIGGSALLKPVPVSRSGWGWTIIPRTNIMVFGTDSNGELTDIGTAENTEAGKDYYTLFERRTADSRGYLTIRYKLYRSADKEHIGTRVPLSTLEKYSDLPDEYTYKHPVGLGLVEVKLPVANCVDGSADGCSVYAMATGLIHNLNVLEKQLNGEFENGRSRIFVSEDLMRTMPDGTKRFSDTVFTGIDDDPESVGVTTFSPALREQSFLARKQDYLRSCESIIGLKRGLLSEVEAVERTAKEITSSEGDYSLTIKDLQDMWETAVRAAVKLCGTLGQVFNVTGAHEVQDDAVAISWGNGVLYDEDKTWADYKDMVARGLIKPEIALGWRFDLPTDTDADLAAIREKYMPAMQQLLEGGEE